MVRLQVPLKGKEIKDKTPYIALYDEIFVGFGENVNANIFDQNKLEFYLGIALTKTLELKADI